MRNSKCPKCERFTSAPKTQKITPNGKYKHYVCSQCKHKHSTIELPMNRYHDLLENAGEANGLNRTKEEKEMLKSRTEQKENQTEKAILHADEKERAKRKQQTDQAWEVIQGKKPRETIEHELSILKLEDSKKALEIMQLKKLLRKAGIKW